LGDGGVKGNLTQEDSATGIEIKPIRIRKSLYILIPMSLAKLMDVTKDTRFLLNIEHSEEKTALIYTKVREGS